MKTLWEKKNQQFLFVCLFVSSARGSRLSFHIYLPEPSNPKQPSKRKRDGKQSENGAQGSSRAHAEDRRSRAAEDGRVSAGDVPHRGGDTPAPHHPRSPGHPGDKLLKRASRCAINPS